MLKIYAISKILEKSLILNFHYKHSVFTQTIIDKKVEEAFSFNTRYDCYGTF